MRFGQDFVPRWARTACGRLTGAISIDEKWGVTVVAPGGGFPHAGGELRTLIRAFEWGKTSIGPLDRWPQCLKTITDFLLASPVPIVLLWNEDGVMIYNDAYSIFAGEKHPQLLGSKVREGWPEVADFNDNIMRVGLAGGTLAYREHELVLIRRGRPEPAWMDLDYSPVLDETGKPAGVIAVVVETTVRVLAERAVRDREAKFRALINATSDVIYQMSADWSEMQPLDGRGFLADSDAPTVRWMDVYLYPEDQEIVRAAANKAIAGKTAFQLEHRVRRADGTVGWTFSRAVPRLSEDGAIIDWFGAATDVTERRRAEEHLRLVVNELNHRVKNNLAMSQAIATQTFRSGDDLENAQDRFAARMMALAQATDLLTGERSSGVSLRGVLDQAVQAHCAGADTCRIAGPDVTLTPKTALSLTLAMHELATNALKYGAWLVPGGEVAVMWDIEQSEDGAKRLQLTWRESGGPTVTRPSQRGFGSRLIERGLAAELGGKVTLQFEPTGLICTIDAPLEAG